MRNNHPGQWAVMAARCWALAGLWLAGPALALTPQWQQLSSGGTGDPHAVITDLAVFPGGGSVATGTYSDHYNGLSSGMLTVRVDGNGQVLWSARLEPAPVIVRAPKVAVGADGTIFAAMLVKITSLGGLQAILVAYEPDGTRRWHTIHGLYLDLEDHLLLGIGPDGHPVLVSQRHDDDGSRWHIRKLSPLDGSLLWQTSWPGGLTGPSTQVQDFTFLDSGDVVLTGSADLAEGGYTLGIVRLSTVDGSVLWARRMPADPMGSEGLAVAAGPDDRLTLLSSSGSWDGHLQVSQLASDGAAAWTTPLPMSSVMSGPAAMGLTGDGQVIAVAGSTGQHHIYRLAGDGGLVWDAPVPPVPDASNPALTGLVINGDRVHLARRFNVYEPTQEHRAQVITLHTSGAQPAWQATMGLPHLQSSPIVGLRVGSGGDLYHYSTRLAAENNADFRIDAYSPADGGPLWTAHEIDQHMPDSLNCPGISSRTRLSAVTPDGGIVFLGCSHLDADTRVLFIEKLSAGGRRLWSRPVADALDRQARPVALDVDAAGDIHLAVTWAGSGDGERELVTMRLTDASGAELQRQVHGTFVDGDQIGAFSQHVDPSGRRYVAWPVTDASGAAIILARYAPAASQADWSVQIPVPSETELVISLKGLDGQGNPVLGGWELQDGASGGSPVLQVHSADDGTLLWNDVEAMLGEVQATLVHPGGDLIVARGGYLGEGLRISRHSPEGAEVWRSPVFRPPGSISASASAWLVADNGDLVFAGVSTEPWVGGFPQYAILGRINGVDGSVAWLQRHVDPGVRYAHVNALMWTPDGLLRTAGMDADAGIPLQAVIVDHDPDTGERLATHAMGGLPPVRLHEAAPGSYRLLSNLSTLEGLRIRTQRLEHSEMIFVDGFQADVR